MNDLTLIFKNDIIVVIKNNIGDTIMRKSEYKAEQKKELDYFKDIYADEEMSVAKNCIANIRKACNIKQLELAKMLLINPTFLYRVEAQKTNISADLLIAAARIMNVSVDDLLGVSLPLPFSAQVRITELEKENKELKAKLAEIKRICTIQD